ncbi:diguanylate cyclase [Legionella sp. PATHC039]|uniref:diguanylate cyclase n=1 Tax=Legionella sp. PATHC039 TaxID=2992042 RepID=UPI00224449EE|nr:diguanylate cyclase [Legionella sp. PATHC039]MCW8396121.1 diguanylate cyclase [Legionella sp. PATHC039]
MAINWVSQSYEIIQSIHTCLYEVVSIESRQRFYLIRDSNDQHMVDMKKMKAENLRSAISKLHVKYGAQPVGQITASIGISVYADDAKSPTGLIEAADKALYQAKNKGRNKVI